MKKYIAGLLLAFIATGAMAVDGYKGVKFGSSLKEIKSAGLCSFLPVKHNKISALSLYQCEDFSFSGKNTMAMVSLINSKFSRLVIIADNDSVQSLFNALSEKYGAPSFLPSPDEVQKAMITGEPIHIKFDNNTVHIRSEKVNGTEVTTLIYTISDFEKTIIELQKNNLSDDI